MSHDLLEARANEFINFMCRHLVVLCAGYRSLIDGRPQGGSRVSFVSGFLLEVGAGWCFATSGHILDDEDELGDAVRTRRIQVDRWSLLVFVGPASVLQRRVPFHFDE